MSTVLITIFSEGSNPLQDICRVGRETNVDVKPSFLWPEGRTFHRSPVVSPAYTRVLGFRVGPYVKNAVVVFSTTNLQTQSGVFGWSRPIVSGGKPDTTSSHPKIPDCVLGILVWPKIQPLNRHVAKFYFGLFTVNKTYYGFKCCKTLCF